MKRLLTILLIFCALPALAQVDRSDVRAGNRKFRKGRYKEAEIDYRKAVVRDSLSLTAQYDLASALYRQQDYAGAAGALERVKGQEGLPAQYFFNAGDAACQQKDWQAAVEAFKQALLQDPGDLDAKENYIYAKKMLENQQNGGGGGSDNNQNQDQQDQQPQISPQQAQQMLRAIQAKEQETQDKVNREKAALLKSRQKEKNW